MTAEYRMTPDNYLSCFYCQMPLAGKYELDHAPVPKRLGGEDVVPACFNCHDLKDRKPLSRWPVSLMVQALEECGPLGRIYLAKVFGADLDRTAALDELDTA